MKENKKKRNPLSPRNDYLFKRIFGDTRDKDMEAIAEKNEGVRKAVIRYKELTADERERMIAEAIEKQRRDEVGRIAYAKNEGRAEGRAEGLAEKQREIAKSMKVEGLNPALINKVTGLSKEEVMKL
jgi:predicted transposase/invertase (TIGR01784 family)